MAEYGEPWHVVREMKDNGQGAEFTNLAVDHYPGETDPENGAPVLESADPDRLARAVTCVNFLAGVSDAVLSGEGIDGALLALVKAVLRDPADRNARDELVDRLIGLNAHRRPA